MHTVWKGAISFGLVHVPVKMFSATEDKDISMRYIHRSVATRSLTSANVRYVKRKWPGRKLRRDTSMRRGNSCCSKRGIGRLAEQNSKNITILDFVDLTEIDPIYFQKTYYLSPDQAGANAYRLLLEAMKQSGKIGIAKIAIRSKSSLAAIRVLDECLSIETIFYPDEIRPISQVPNLPERTEVNSKELDMAKLLIDQLSTPFDPEKYTDDYRERLLDLINSKVSGEEIKIAPARQETNVVDLMVASRQASRL